MQRSLRFIFLTIALSALLTFVMSMVGSVPAGYAQEPSNVPDTPLDTAFTYQGFLVYQGSYYDGKCDFRFGLYNVKTGGEPVADPIFMPGVRVYNGYFTVKLDFGADVINGTKRWLQIAVHCPPPDDAAALKILRPRQELTPAPHALALPGLWTQPGASPNLIGGYYGNVVDAGVRGATIGGGGHTSLATSDVAWPYPSLEAEDADRANRAVNTVTEPFGTIGGGLGNTADLLAVVGGGVYNDAVGPGTAIGGGGINTADGLAATVAGGYKNKVTGTFATIGGGEYNAAAGNSTTISGGAYNDAGKYWTTVGGGTTNLASGHGATVAGGGINTASADGTTVAGGGYNTANNRGGTVGGGEHNRAGSALTPVDPTRLDTFRFDIFPLDPTADDPTPFDPIPPEPALRGIYTTVGGGAYNTASGPGTTIGGGGVNTAGGLVATVAGGYLNVASGGFGSVGGGEHNIASGYGATVGGGDTNKAGTNAPSSDPNARGAYTTVGGGTMNVAGGHRATVAGGGANEASGYGTTVGGGACNRAGNDGPAPEVCNTDDDPTTDPDARGVFATISGGAFNAVTGHFGTVGGGGNNIASGLGATVGGGLSNSAGDGSASTPETAGLYATVPGGFQNSAQGNYSLAAGKQAKADHQGAFVWADASNADLASTGSNQFIVRASGGIWLGTTSTPSIGQGVFLDTSTGAYLSSSGTWTNASDRQAKDNFTPVDGQEVLARLAEVPISTWNYKVDAPAVRHMGPMAQDFYAAFGLGSDDTAIATVDTDGVALAAIQELHQIVQEQQDQIVTLQQQNSELETRLAALEAFVTSLTEVQAGGE